MSCIGYGICGHKNEYSQGVKNGNWVEERIGQNLNLCPSYSWRNLKHVDSDKVDEGDKKFRPVDTGEKNDVCQVDINSFRSCHNSLSYTLLLGHPGADDKERFTTTYGSSYFVDGANAKEMGYRRERKKSSALISHASKKMKNELQDDMRKIGKQVTLQEETMKNSLPDFRRRKLLIQRSTDPSCP